MIRSFRAATLSMGLFLGGCLLPGLSGCGHPEEGSITFDRDEGAEKASVLNGASDTEKVKPALPGGKSMP